MVLELPAHIYPLGTRQDSEKGNEALTRPTFHQRHSNLGRGIGIVFTMALMRRDVQAPREAHSGGERPQTRSQGR